MTNPAGRRAPLAMDAHARAYLDRDYGTHWGARRSIPGDTARDVVAALMTTARLLDGHRCIECDDDAANDWGEPFRPDEDDE